MWLELRCIVEVSFATNLGGMHGYGILGSKFTRFKIGHNCEVLLLDVWGKTSYNYRSNLWSVCNRSL